MIVAHRGASFDAPENTLAAFQLAWAQGADGIEGDFYLTADNEIVCIHDKDTKRTTGVDLPVEASTLEALRKLDAGKWKAPQFTGERIPTFKEVLDCVPPGKRFVIELKSHAQIVPKLADELQKYHRDDITLLIITFDEATAAACKQRLPDVPVHWLTSFKQSSFNQTFRPTLAHIAETLERCKADGIGMSKTREVIDKTFVDQLIASGCDEFHVWTVDDPNDAKYFRDLGAMGITTNRPGLIRSVLAASE